MRMSARLFAFVALVGPLTIAATVAEEPRVSAITVTPATVVLHGSSARQQLIVTGRREGRDVDFTSKAGFESESPNVVTVNSAGVVTPVANGSGSIRVVIGNLTQRVTVRVVSANRPLPVDFERDIVPIFSRFGCNAGACHGKAGGQNGFKLSLLGFDSQFDYDALTKEGRGRRLFPPHPERSLLLLKPTGQSPHGGGKRLEFGGAEYEILRRWIAEGTPRRQPGTPALVGVTVEPGQRIMKNKTSQRLIVTARYSDGQIRDVTHLAAFQSNESAVAGVDQNGLVTAGTITGEAAVMARYMGQIAICNVAVPLPGTVPNAYYEKLPRSNFIDGLVWKKLQRLGLKPSEPAGEHKFLRRVYIDIIGRLPSLDEARKFLADKSSNKRETLIDRLLDHPEYAEHWANKWADLLRPNPYRVGIKTTLNYDAWIRNAFRKNKPYDQFVRELVTARGGTYRNGAVTLFRDRRSPAELTTIVSQLFLGIRLECARCHHHPFEVWGQKDFYSFAAYFARIGRKGRGLSPPISGSEEFVFTATSGSVKHPLTGEVMQPRPLFGTAPPVDEADDPRESLAAWITSGENPFFVQVMANRVWADLMGRGLVEPVDDLRATNPPSNGPLLEALGDDFRAQGYDVKKLIRRITTSYVYGLGSLPNDRNVVDTRNYSRHYRQRLRGEVMLDSIVNITQVPETYAAMPPGSRAKELWTRRIDSLFLDAFGRPDPNQDPPCDRTTDTTVVQVLHLMNSENLYRKATDDSGRAAKLAASTMTPAEIIEELYLLVYSRVPEKDELGIGLELFQKEGTARRQATEDLLWALLNTPEFVFKD